MALHTLYDDTALASNTPLELGATLVNTGEVSAVEAVIRALEAVFAQTGGADVPDEKLLSSEQWPRVVEAAAAAWRTMTGAA
jgi:hypothetical protein